MTALPTNTTTAPWLVVAILGLLLGLVDVLAPRLWPLVTLDDCDAACSRYGGLKGWEADACWCHAPAWEADQGTGGALAEPKLTGRVISGRFAEKLLPSTHTNESDGRRSQLCVLCLSLHGSK
jgi:hypothetical protein